MSNKFSRNCPSCEKEIGYSSKNALNKAEENAGTCFECYSIRRKEKAALDTGPYLRECPQCNLVIEHKCKTSCRNAIKNSAVCFDCSHKNRIIHNEEFYIRICKCGNEVRHTTIYTMRTAIEANSGCMKCVIKHDYSNVDFENLTRKCSKCGEEQKYLNKKSLKNCVIDKTICRKCSSRDDDYVELENFIKTCSECGNQHEYSNRYTYLSSVKNSSICKSCSQKGERSACFGKSLSQEHKDSISKSLVLSKKIRSEKIKKWHQENPGNSIHDKIIRKYGNDLKEFFKEKGLKNKGKMAGENNPMYGKPSPQGSGNGWSGWYLGHFFRSLIELSYMVEFLSASGCIWESAETNKFKIEYTDSSGQIRNYFPDFLVNNKYIIEIKPENLFKSELVLLKKEAAEKWCEANGYEYLLIEPKKLSNEKVLKLYNSGEIKFTDRYEEKFKERYLKH